MKKNIYLLPLLCAGLFVFAQKAGVKQMNIIFILAGDHRYDVMGFMNKIEGIYLLQRGLGYQ
jgi:hypothetical protein